VPALVAVAAEDRLQPVGAVEAVERARERRGVRVDRHRLAGTQFRDVRAVHGLRGVEERGVARILRARGGGPRQKEEHPALARSAVEEPGGGGGQRDSDAVARRGGRLGSGRAARRRLGRLRERRLQGEQRRRDPGRHAERGVPFHGHIVESP
jgi:hypothetical protein